MTAEAPAGRKIGDKGVGRQHLAADARHIERRRSAQVQAAGGDSRLIPIDAELLLVAERDLDQAGLDLDLLVDAPVGEVDERLDRLLAAHGCRDLRDAAEAVEDERLSILEHCPQLGFEVGPEGVLIRLGDGNLGRVREAVESVTVGRIGVEQRVGRLVLLVGCAGISAVAVGAAQRDRGAAGAAARELGIVDGVEDRLEALDDEAGRRLLDVVAIRLGQGRQRGAQGRVIQFDGDLARHVRFDEDGGLARAPQGAECSRKRGLVQLQAFDRAVERGLAAIVGRRGQGQNGQTGDGAGDLKEAGEVHGLVKGLG